MSNKHNPEFLALAPVVPVRRMIVSAVKTMQQENRVGCDYSAKGWDCKTLSTLRDALIQTVSLTRR